MCNAVSVTEYIQRMPAACFTKMRKLCAVIRLQDIRSIPEVKNGSLNSCFAPYIIEKRLKSKNKYVIIIIGFL